MYKELESKYNKLKMIKKEKCERLFNLEVVVIKSRIKEIDDRMEKGYFAMYNQIKEIKDKLEKEINILNDLQEECTRLEVEIKNKNESLEILDEKLKILRYKMSDLKKQKNNVRSIKKTLRDSYAFLRGKLSYSKEYIGIKSIEEAKVINLREHSDDDFIKQYFPSMYKDDLNKYLN